MTENQSCPLCGEKLKTIPEFYELFCDNPKCVLQGYDENNLKKSIPQITRIRQEAKQEVFDELEKWIDLDNLGLADPKGAKLEFKRIKKKHGVD